MENSQSRIEWLYNLWLRQELNEEEEKEWLDLLDKYDLEDLLAPLLKNSWMIKEEEDDLSAEDKHRMAVNVLSRIKEDHEPEEARHFLRNLSHKWRWAAAVLILLSSAALFIGSHHSDRTLTKGVASLTAVPPGKDGAILTLANGARISLDSQSNGLVATQYGVKAVMKNGQLIYRDTAYCCSGPAPVASAGVIACNTISTSRGRQFRLTLPDGTAVWLNAASSVRYPTKFPDNERKIEVTGEAYFEVAKDPSRPFSINFPSSPGGERQGKILALGTSFNVSAYTDDAAASITLLEGSVQVSGSGGGSRNEILHPGQQASVLYGNSQGDIMVKEADTGKAVAWIRGSLNFHDMGVKEVMRQISRWYDVDIEYEGKVPEIVFWGEMSRSEDLSTVLNFMKHSGVNYKMGNGGKKIIIY